MNMNHLSAPTPVAFCLICDFSTAMMDVSLPCRVNTLMVFAMLVHGVAYSKPKKYRLHEQKGC